MSTTTTRKRIVGPFNPEATTCGELEVGQLAVFDAMFGAEEVLERHVHNVGNEVVPNLDQVPFVPPSSMPWQFVRLLLRYRVADEFNNRYVFRAMQEPITRWRPIAP